MISVWKVASSRSLAIGLGVFVLGGVLGGCGKKKAAPPPEPTVVVAEVETKTIPIIRNYNGTVQAVKSVDVIPNVTGYLNERLFTEGALVKKGDPLYLIDPRPFRAALDQAKAQLQEGQAQVEYWTAEAERFEGLTGTGAVSEDDIQKAAASLREARANALMYEAEVESAQINLEYTNVVAPFEGRVQTTQRNIGALVTAQQDVLTRVVEIDPVYIEFNLTRREMFDLQSTKGKGILSAEDVRVQLILPNGEVHPNEGKIDFIGSEVNPMTDSLLVRAVVANKGGDGPEVNLVSGQYARVRLYLGEQAGTLVVPRQALVETQSGPHVYVVKADGTAEQRAVEMGSAYEQFQVITSGLKEGEKVVVSGLQSVQPGSKVKISSSGGTGVTAGGGTGVSGGSMGTASGGTSAPATGSRTGS
ncbi:MAG: efflux RND transporter periplasmic adaptor subunit [Verrucomicrobiota bacterium]